MEVETSIQMPERGKKRPAAETALFSSPKRARSSPAPPDASASDSASQSEAEDTPPTHSPSTPSTPSSSFPSRQKRLPCPEPGCTKLFSRSAHLAEHVNGHKGIRAHHCAQCPKTFVRKTHLAHHVKNAHTAVRDYVCDWDDCGKAFTTGTRLRRHRAAHEKKEQYKCAHCGQGFRKHATRERHVKAEHEGQGSTNFVCRELVDADPQADGSSLGKSECSAGFASVKQLATHQQSTHEADIHFNCAICASTFPTQTSLQAHLRDAHPPVCPHCSHRAATASDLRRHVATQHSAAPPAIPCPRASCIKTFSKPANLAVHLRTTHDGLRYICGAVPLAQLNNIHDWAGTDACGRDFSAKASLEKHVRIEHLGLPEPRRPKRHGGRASAAVAVISAVAGTAYRDARRPRNFPCLVTGCAFRFARRYDRAIHARARHGLGSEEVALLSAAADAAAAQKRLGRPAKQMQKQKQQADAAVRPEEDGEDDWTAPLEQGAADGGAFWLGDTAGSGGTEDGGDVEGEEMFRLTRDAGDGEDEEEDGDEAEDEQEDEGDEEGDEEDDEDEEEWDAPGWDDDEEMRWDDYDEDERPRGFGGVIDPRLLG